MFCILTGIIVINDCSTDLRYHDLDKIYSTVKFIHLPINTRKKHNIKAAQGLVRNEGINIATGDWIAFIDDDDFYTDQEVLVFYVLFWCAKNLIRQIYKYKNIQKYKYVSKIFFLFTFILK